MKLYAWQRNCLHAWQKHNYRGIINAVTGSGKTRLALSAIRLLQKEYPKLRIRVVTPTIALANQWRQAILRDSASHGELPGFYGDGTRDDSDRTVMIYVVNSARNGLADHIRTDFAQQYPVLLICDECHRYLSKENYRMFEFLTGELSDFPLYHCLGLSATPFGNERDSALRRVLGEEIFQYDFSDAAADGVIAPHVIGQIAVSFLPEEGREYAALCDKISRAAAMFYQTYPRVKDLPSGRFMKELRRLAAESDMDPSDPAAALLLLLYQRKNLVVTSEARIRCCLSLLNHLDRDRRILIFCERIDQAETLYRQILRAWGSICGIYHSELSKEARQRNLEDFRRKRTRILVSCRALDEGLDVPDASVGIVLSSSAVRRQRIQRLGRIVRTDPDKDYACLYYIYIRESSEDAAYLPLTDHARVFDLKYFTLEDDFSNDLYLYAASQLFQSAKAASFPAAELKELRTCILEGVCHPDYLLPGDIQTCRLSAAGSAHRRNYWRVMLRIGEYIAQE